MNDYELVYLIRTHSDSIAFDFLYQKYRRFIWKFIHLMHIESKEQDDFFQEGILTLYKAVETFPMKSKNKTFTRYFRINLTKTFLSLDL